MNVAALPKNRMFYGWWIVAGTFVLLFLYAGAGFYSFSLFIQPLEESFGWTRSQISLAISLYLLVHGLTAPAVGFLIERFNPRNVVACFSVLSGLAFIMVSFTQTLWYFYFSYILLSIGTTGIGYVPLSTILSRWFTRKRGSAIGIAMVGLAVGGLMMAPAVGLLLEYFSWRVSFSTLGVLVLVVALPISLFVIKSHPSDMGLLPDGDLPQHSLDQDYVNDTQESIEEAQNEDWPFFAAIRSRSFWGLTGAYICVSLALMGVMQHQVPLITEKGISPATAAAALGLTAGLGGLGKYTFGRITELMPFRLAAVICYSLQVVGLLILLQLNTPAVIWLYIIIFGFSMGGSVVLLPIGVADYFGLTALGTLMGIVSLAQAIGYSVGATMSAMIYDAFGSYTIALTTYVIIYLCAIVFLGIAGKPKAYSKNIQY